MSLVKPDRVSATVRYSQPTKPGNKDTPWKTVELGAEAPVPKGVSALKAHRDLVEQLSAHIKLAFIEWTIPKKEAEGGD